MESIEACEHVPWSPGQNSSSRLVVVQKTNDLLGLMDGVSEQDSKVTLFWAGTRHGYPTGKRRRASVPASYACAHVYGIWNFGAHNMNLSIFIGDTR
jgi:hypothetical protein